ncbi:Thiamine biosynthesis lipoprotein ApbE precursor [Raoultella planticola]|uniref:FAD:protein FMN transferase n=1 Tax=Raoultella planticola TaxID=575 RepID=A0A485AHN9_RAOPL|nr:Thiamine biosynthesis lipoprotein ApbE precursor [Raoultella planticola]
MRFNHATTTDPWPVSEAMADIVTLSLRIGAKTAGAMDITVGPLVNLWGFGPPTSNRLKRRILSRSPPRKRARGSSI